MSSCQLRCYRVTLNEDAGDKHPLHYYCKAIDEEDAEDNALDKYSGAQIIHTMEVTDVECEVYS